jgi:PHD/YefM family antitoxin component YafN of YafNO toxin-antitoxin module
MPIIDRKVKYQGLSGLRKLDGKQLRELDDSMLVIQEHNSPLAVMLSYEKYLILQDQLHTAMETLELLGDPDELSALLAGLKDVRSGRVESLEDIRKGLTNNKQKQ